MERLNRLVIGANASIFQKINPKSNVEVKSLIHSIMNEFNTQFQLQFQECPQNVKQFEQFSKNLEGIVV